jgi:outer membrane protein assembly factor BamB
MNWVKNYTSIASCAMACVSGSVFAQDWPQWRGPARDGKASAFTVPKTWPKELSKKWTVHVGDGVATPSLVGERLYVFARDQGAETTRCLNAATGEQLWSDRYDALPPSGSASGFAGPRACPTVAGGKVVTLGVRGVLSVLDAASGKLIWRKDDFKGVTPRFYTSASPLIVDGICIAELGGGKDGGIVAYELASGNEKWRWTGDGPAYGSPMPMTVEGTKLIVAMTETKVLALNAADGSLAWETPFPVKGRGYNVATPIIAGQTLIYTGCDRGVIAVKLEKRKGAIVASELWKNTDNSVMFNTPGLKDGLLFGFSQANEFFCLNTKDGKTAWTNPFTAGVTNRPPEGGRRQRDGYGTIVDVGSVLLGLTPSAELVVLEPTEKAYVELARLKVADTQTYASPVPSGNRLFVKDQESVSLWTLP